jgi:hypothetical protein
MSREVWYCCWPLGGGHEMNNKNETGGSRNYRSKFQKVLPPMVTRLLGRCGVKQSSNETFNVKHIKDARNDEDDGLIGEFVHGKGTSGCARHFQIFLREI